MIDQRHMRLAWLGQALFVVFLWSISKIILKMGLLSIPPYIFVAMIQVVALVVLLIYAQFHRHKEKPKFSSSDIYAAVLSGVVGFVGANLFMIIGLQYVTGATAGLIAATSSIFAIIMSLMFLKERPLTWQYGGVGLILVGSYIFLSDQVVGGSMVGVGLLILAEMAFAFSGSLVRMINERHKVDASLPLALIGNTVGAVVLVPLALLIDGVPQIDWNWQIGFWIVVLGLIFAFGGLLWNLALDRLRLVEVSVVSNTMMVQVALWSVLFLGESLTFNNFAGGALVLVGAFVTDGQMLLPQLYNKQMANSK